jgi:hypothetical protein
MATPDLTPEQKEFDAELRQRAGVDGRARFDLIDAMTAAVAEGHVVDVRAQPDDPVHYTVRLHPKPGIPFAVSHDGDDWRECFVRCHRQADDLAAEVLADQNRQVGNA